MSLGGSLLSTAPGVLYFAPGVLYFSTHWSTYLGMFRSECQPEDASQKHAPVLSKPGPVGRHVTMVLSASCQVSTCSDWAHEESACMNRCECRIFTTFCLGGHVSEQVGTALVTGSSFL